MRLSTQVGKRSTFVLGQAADALTPTALRKDGLDVVIVLEAGARDQEQEERDRHPPRNLFRVKEVQQPDENENHPGYDLEHTSHRLPSR